MSKKTQNKGPFISEKTLLNGLKAVCLFFGIIMIARCFYGIEKTDEAYHIADGIAALNGNYPFAYNFSSAAGMNVFTVPFLAVFRLFSPTWEGVFLYMRLCFTLIRLAILVGAYFLLRKQYDRKYLLIALMFMIPFNGAVIGSFHYNTICVWMMFLSAVLLGSAALTDNRKRLYLSAAFSAFFMGYSVMAHPLSVFCVFILFGLILFLYPKEYRIKGALIFAGTISVMGIAVLLIIGGLAGFDHLVTGLDIMLFGRGGTKSRTTGSKYMDIMEAYLDTWVIMAIIFLAVIGIKCVATWMKKRNTSKIDRQNIVTLASVVSLLVILFTVTDMRVDDRMYYVGAMIVFAVIPLVLFRHKPIIYFVVLPFLSFVLAEILMTNNSDPEWRFLYAWPIFFAYFLYMFEQDMRDIRIIACLIVCILLTYEMGMVKDYVYRDVALAEMDYTMPSGIYKGLKTERSNGEDVLELEAYIHNITDEGEWVKFMDNVPVGYLFQDGKVCDIRTWDNMNYTYYLRYDRPDNRNNPTKMFKYFLNREAIPDKLIYVDFGRDDHLSIEDEFYNFNYFVNDFYEFSTEELLNDTFRIKVYERTDSYEEFEDWVVRNGYVE